MKNVDTEMFAMHLFIHFSDPDLSEISGEYWLVLVGSGPYGGFQF